MTDTKPTIEEQIAAVINEADVVATTCVAGAEEPLRAAAESLKELAAIKTQPVPVEPEHVKFTRKSLQYAPPPTEASRRSYRQDKELIAYIDSLQSALQVAQQDKERLYKLNVDCEAVIIRQREERKKVEERNKRLVELLREAQKLLFLQNDFNSMNCAKRIDAEQVEEA